MKKLIAFSLAMAMMMSATGCADKNDNSSSIPTETITVSQTIYKEERMELPEKLASIHDIVYDKEKGLCIFYSDYDFGEKIAVYNDSLQLVNTTDLDMDENTSITDISMSGEGSVCALCTTTIPPEDDSIEKYSQEYWENCEKSLTVKYFSFDGELIAEDDLGDLDGLITGNSFIRNFSKCGDDYLLSIFGEAILADKNGNVKKNCSENGGTYISDIDGCIWFCHTSYMSCTETLSEPTNIIEYPDSVSMSNLPLSGDDKFLMYLRLSDGFYGMTRDNQMIKLIDYTGSLLSAFEISSVCPIGDKEFIISGSNATGVYLSVLKARPDDYVEDRQTVTVGIHGVVNMSDMELGTDFSRMNDNYTVEFREYQFDSDDLKEDILTGNAPDVYIFDDISELHRYTNLGAFGEIDELSSKYGGISSADLLPNISEAIRYKGGIYAIPERFNVNMYLANSEVVSKEYSDWTLDEFFEIAENMPEGMAIGDNIFFYEYRKVFYILCYANLSHWVNFERAECYFDSDEFIHVLNFCRSVNYAEPYDYDNDTPETAAYTFHMLVNKQALLYDPISLGTLSDFRSEAALNSMTFDEAAFVNPPGSNGGSIEPERFFTVLNNGKCQQGGWEFLNYVMSYDRQAAHNPFNFPVRKDAFEQALKDQAVELNSGDKITDGFNQYEYTYDPHISDKEFEYIRERILSCKSVSGRYGAIETICSEETGRFFAGECTAEECANMIQTRASIYISEQYT